MCWLALSWLSIACCVNAIYFPMYIFQCISIVGVDGGCDANEGFYSNIDPKFRTSWSALSPVGTPPPLAMLKNNVKTQSTKQRVENTTTQKKHKHRLIKFLEGYSSTQVCDKIVIENIWKYLSCRGFCQYQRWLRWDLSNCGKSKKFVGRQLEVCDGTPWYRGSNRSLDIDLLSRAEHRNWLNAEFSWDLKNWQFGIWSNLNTEHKTASWKMK